MEEGDADRMLSEFVRVTKPGGKVGVVVRSTDLPRWVNLPLGSALKNKVEVATFFSGNVTDKGCADASLYRRMNRRGLKDVAMLPQWASHKDGERLDYLHDRIIGVTQAGRTHGMARRSAIRPKPKGRFLFPNRFTVRWGVKPGKG